MKKLIFILVALAAFLPFQAFALANPDTIQITAVNSYSDVATPGDILYWVDYTLLYTVPPSENISEGWIGRFIDVGGAGQLSNIVPAAGGGIPNGGYSQGIFCFYFASAPTATGTFTVYLTGNPALSPTPAGITTTSITSKSTSDLPGDVRERAQILEDIWNLDLLEATTTGPLRFTTDGEHYFTTACPGIRTLVPDLFTFTTMPQEIYDHTSDNTFMNAREAIWNGTLIGSSITNLQIALPINDAMARLLISSIVLLPLVGMVGIIATQMNGSYSGGVFALQIGSGWIILSVLAWIGLVTFIIWGLISLGAFVLIGFGIFMARGG